MNRIFLCFILIFSAASLSAQNIQTKTFTLDAPNDVDFFRLFEGSDSILQIIEKTKSPYFNITDETQLQPHEKKAKQELDSLFAPRLALKLLRKPYIYSCDKGRKYNLFLSVALYNDFLKPLYDNNQYLIGSELTARVKIHRYNKEIFFYEIVEIKNIKFTNHKTNCGGSMKPR